ncbi:hypothetical protein CY34DRAFT_805071 [Suillus luteus UH-Slu-Lm8-n1]|uniref:Uncharacterized protein n=1 Tax=Suillus luteus UH-Slu-Lm8-n1 TaxID=930992 RepID=A0A0D0AWV7_9AGAM|nr:hypothetical protein CY34DRAFT_805071 [Suillus luteus UH-Slu-Lm8-n1]
MTQSIRAVPVTDTVSFLHITSNVARKCGHKNWNMQHHGRVTTASFSPGSSQQMLRGGLLALGPQTGYLNKDTTI